MSHGCPPARFQQRHDPQHGRTLVSAQRRSRARRRPLLTRDQAKALADRVLSFGEGAIETRVNITSEWSGNTRFADASITTSGGITDTIAHGDDHHRRRRASASTNVLDDACAEADGRSGRAPRAAVARRSGADAGARSADRTRRSTPSSKTPPTSTPEARAARGQARR